MAVITVDDVRELALSLPGAYEQASYGDRPSWRTKPRIFATVGDDPATLVVWVASLDEKQALLTADPATFRTTPHYDGHAIVLVDLGVVQRDEAAEMITDSWRLRAPRKLIADAEDR